jgi:hypothetical protein
MAGLERYGGVGIREQTMGLFFTMKMGRTGGCNDSKSKGTISSYLDPVPHDTDL